MLCFGPVQRRQPCSTVRLGERGESEGYRSAYKYHFNVALESKIFPPHNIQDPVLPPDSRSSF